MDISSMMTSSGGYLKKEDISKPVTAEITSTDIREFKNDDGTVETKVVVNFQDVEKPLLCNKTNLKRLAKICGSTDTDNWIGKKCMIYVDDMVEMGGKIVGGLRVRPAQDFDDSDIPF